MRWPFVRSPAWDTDLAFPLSELSGEEEAYRFNAIYDDTANERDALLSALGFAAEDVDLYDVANDPDDVFLVAPQVVENAPQVV